MLCRALCCLWWERCDARARVLAPSQCCAWVDGVEKGYGVEGDGRDVAQVSLDRCFQEVLAKSEKVFCDCIRHAIQALSVCSDVETLTLRKKAKRGARGCGTKQHACFQ